MIIDPKQPPTPEPLLKKKKKGPSLSPSLQGLQMAMGPKPPMQGG